VRQNCTQGKQNGRAIDRSEFAEDLEDNTKRVVQNPDYYRKRQQIAEHMYGTLKRQRGFTHTNVRGKEKVLGEVGLMFIGYNLTRCISILGAGELIRMLRGHCLSLVFGMRQVFLRLFGEIIFTINKKLFSVSPIICSPRLSLILFNRYFYTESLCFCTDSRCEQRK
ncbi:MAG: hypothetical protein GYA51_08060, partial [Candidatus Methanofastidiosa archaeon]|nr:hypothetical protein [Candidatus Methanofastidiosa archaeon]